MGVDDRMQQGEERGRPFERRSPAPRKVTYSAPQVKRSPIAALAPAADDKGLGTRFGKTLPGPVSTVIHCLLRVPRTIDET